MRNCVWVLGSDPWLKGIPPSAACSPAPGGRTYVLNVPPSTCASALKISGHFGTSLQAQQDQVLQAALPEPMELLPKNKERKTQNT